MYKKPCGVKYKLYLLNKNTKQILTQNGIGQYTYNFHIVI